MSAWALASRPVKRFLTFSALASVISTIAPSSPLNSIISQTPVVPAWFAGPLRGAEKGCNLCLPQQSPSRGNCAMAKLKKAPGRLIGRWKQEAIAANKEASDEDLAQIINEAAKKQGYDYTITPEKVRTRAKKP